MSPTASHPNASLWRQALAAQPLSHRDIAERAYAKYLKHPGEADCAVRDWLEAEQELLLERLRDL
jgi:hypothetical protein